MNPLAEEIGRKIQTWKAKDDFGVPNQKLKYW